MGHTPFGYKIQNGRAVIDEDAAVKIRLLYANYLSGMSLVKAAQEAGIETYHGTAKRIIQNSHYPGDDFYPALIDRQTYERAATEIKGVPIFSAGTTEESQRSCLPYLQDFS